MRPFVISVSVLVLSLLPAPAAAAEDPLQRAIAAVSSEREDVGIVAEAVRGDSTAAFEAGAGTRGAAAGPRHPGDHFRIASITKVMIATVVLQLAQEGRISSAVPAGPGQLATPLARTPLRGELAGLRDWLGRDPGYREENITVADLLRHTGGVREWTEDPWVRTTLLGGPAALLPDRRNRTWTWRDFKRAIEDEPAMPLGAYHYSNTGYLLLGMLIDRVAGPYQAEVRRRVIDPLGLAETTFPTAGTISRNLPAPHSRHYTNLFIGQLAAKPFGVHDYTELNPSAIGSAGEAISTTGDLNRLLSGLLGGRLLGPEMMRAMSEDALVPSGTGLRYGYGMQVRTLTCADGPPVTLYGHSGLWHGSMSWAFADRSGTHRVTFNLNLDWVERTAGPDRILRAEFDCPA